MDEEELPTYDEKADIWSVGALTFEALTGRQPFLADGAAEMAAVVAARLGTVDPETGLPAFIAREPGLSPAARDFVAACLAADPAARPGAAELLGHPWLGGPPSGRPSFELVATSRAAEAAAGAPPPAGGAAAAPDAAAPLARAASGESGASGSSSGTFLPAAALQRCQSAADTLLAATPHLTTRSLTGRLEGSLPGTRAAAAAAMQRSASTSGAGAGAPR
jgi:serine/threonine protein kinase